MSLEVPIFIILIAICLYFITKWLLTRFSSKNDITISAIFISLALAPVVYFLLVIAFFSYLFYEPQKDFNQERWLTFEHLRYEMRDDLVESEQLIGKSRQKLIKYLGVPTSKDSLRNLTYDLGLSGAGLGWQHNYLQIKLSNEVVTNVKLIEIPD